ncbi:hypothetical protein V8C44DRAFT_266244 [Trichoderma aethiopicum]
MGGHGIRRGSGWKRGDQTEARLPRSCLVLRLPPFDAPSHPRRSWQQWHRKRLLCFGLHDDSPAALFACWPSKPCPLSIFPLPYAQACTQFHAHSSKSLITSFLLLSYIQLQISFARTTNSHSQPFYASGCFYGVLVRRVYEKLLTELSFQIECSGHGFLRLYLVREP